MKATQFVISPNYGIMMLLLTESNMQIVPLFDKNLNPFAETAGFKIMEGSSDIAYCFEVKWSGHDCIAIEYRLDQQLHLLLVDPSAWKVIKSFRLESLLSKLFNFEGGLLGWDRAGRKVWQMGEDETPREAFKLPEPASGSLKEYTFLF